MVFYVNLHFNMEPLLSYIKKLLPNHLPMTKRPRYAVHLQALIYQAGFQIDMATLWQFDHAMAPPSQHLIEN